METLYDYDWFCDQCGASGHNSQDERIWKFCPYCGREIRIHDLNETTVLQVKKRFPIIDKYSPGRDFVL